MWFKSPALAGHKVKPWLAATWSVAAGPCCLMTKAWPTIERPELSTLKEMREYISLLECQMANLDNETNETCSICLEDIELGNLCAFVPCGHANTCIDCVMRPGRSWNLTWSFFAFCHSICISTGSRAGRESPLSRVPLYRRIRPSHLP